MRDDSPPHFADSQAQQAAPYQAQTVIAATILRHLHALITTGQAWDPAIATHGTPPRLEPAAAA